MTQTMSQSLQYQGKLQTTMAACKQDRPHCLNPFSIRENCRPILNECFDGVYGLNPFSIRENCRQMLEAKFEEELRSQSLQYQGKLQTK